MKRVSMVVIAVCAVAVVALALRMQAGIAANYSNALQFAEALEDTQKQIEQLTAELAEDRAALEEMNAAIARLERGPSRPPESTPPDSGARPEPPARKKNARGISSRPDSRAESATPREESEEGLVPLRFDLPRPMFVNIPKSLESAYRLDGSAGRRRPPFLVPEGVSNVAFGKMVTASDNAPVAGELSMITDGDKEGSEGSFVELHPGVQWVQIDLGGPQELFAVVVWHYHAEPRVYKDVVVRVSGDPGFGQGVTTLFNNDYDNSAGLGLGNDFEYVETCEGRLIDARGVTGRYVRLYSNGNSSDDINHLIEVEVYGLTAEPAPLPPPLGGSSQTPEPPR